MDDEKVSMPRWVKASIGLTVAVVVALVVFLLIGQDHGPGRHSGGHGAFAAPAKR